MRVVNILYRVGALLLLVGAVMRMSHPGMAGYIYMAGAILFVLMQFVGRTRNAGFVVRRLVFQQQIGGICLIVAGVLMFTHTRNEWIVAMFIGALLELYTAYRIPKELEK